MKYLTIEKVIELLESNKERQTASCYIHVKNFIKEALEELKQYRAIGTVGKCRAAMEKQKAKKMESAWCPCCGKYLTAEYMNKKYHCIYCGQKLDWSDE